MPKRKRGSKKKGYKPRKGKGRSARKTRRTNRGNKTTSLRAGNVIKDKTYVKLKWEAGKVSRVSDLQYVIRGNSVYDPEYATAPGLSAIGFAFWKQIYFTYVVTGCSVSVWANNRAEEPMVINIVPSKYGSLPVNLHAETEINTRYKWLGSKGQSNSTGKCKMYFSTKKMYGVSSAEVNSNYHYAGRTGGGGQSATNPELGWNFIINFRNQDDVDTNTLFDYRIIVKYYVTFREPITYQAYSVLDDSMDPVGGGDGTYHPATDADIGGVPEIPAPPPPPEAEPIVPIVV